jgi:hypothetical protein
MQLPFSEAQFLDVFGTYNSSFWPVVVVLWLASAALVVGWVARVGAVDRWIVALLAIHWLWAGLAYHVLCFTAINPAAYVFGGLFILQAGLLAWFGLLRSRLRFSLSTGAWSALGGGLIAYSLVYPLLMLAVGFHYPRMATFGVPCPTTLLTAGFLLATAPPAPRPLMVVPLLWSIIGGSAALLLGVYSDWALVVCAVLLGVAVAIRRAAPAAPAQAAR